MLERTSKHVSRPLSLLRGGPLAVALTVLLLSGCGGSEQTTLTPTASDETVENVPDWFVSPPEDPNYLFGAATATSRSMQMAVDKATTAARGNIASTLESKFEGLTKRFQEEVGEASESQMLTQFTQAQQEVVSQVLRGVSTREREIKKEESIYRAYVLMNMPVGQAAAELMSKISENEEMYTRFRSTQAFDEMEEEVEEYEQFREEQRRERQQ